MSYEIYYDRAFVRVGSGYIPMVNQGSNNTWEINLYGRQIPEKNWQVLNWKHRNRLVFSESEIHEIAKEYDEINQKDGTCFKTRYRSFQAGEFERWILCGMKSAYTIEEYVSFGNSFELHDYSSNKTEEWKLYSFKTTGEFFALTDNLKGRPLLNLHFTDNREVYRPVKKQLTADYKTEPEYYVLSNPDYTGFIGETECFFCKFRGRRSIAIEFKHQSPAVRSFPTMKAAEKYLDKYKKRLAKYEVKKISKILLA